MNRLGDETSPYLQQHANDPVDWHPWGEEALALARSENKPIFMSIGFSACHTCQVMARESFASESVARALNDYFVCIKVDREERPDLDRVYQTAHQVLARQGGGWPLNMFLDPKDLLPFFGGTYFPPQPDEGKPGFRDVVRGIGKAFGEKNDKEAEFKSQLNRALEQILGGGEPGRIEATMFDRACGQIDSSFDADNGGFSESPKYPHPAGLDLLHDAMASDAPEKSDRAREMLDFTLRAMARGGLFDHLGGGFFRYCSDAQWRVPRFEKMLYDNGLLLSLYARRGGKSGEVLFRRTAMATADWLVRDMQLADGGFSASLSADADGEEGGFYLWSDLEVQDIAGNDYEAVAAHYGLNEKPGFEKKWHLREAAPRKDDNAHAEIPAAVAAVCTRLLERRNGRKGPARDEKILTAWNALAIRGLADAGRELERADYIDSAARALDYLRKNHWDGKRLATASRDGAGQINAYLDDYAFLIEAVLALLAARWRSGDLQFAMDLADAMLEQFEDSKNGGFFFTAADQEPIIQRVKAFNDDALPSGNGAATRALMELALLSGEARYGDAAERTLRAGMSTAGRWPSAHGTLVRALLDHTEPPPRVILRGSDAAAAKPWTDAAREHLSVRERTYFVPDDDTKLPEGLAKLGAEAGAVITAHTRLKAGEVTSATTLEAFSENLRG